jgi:Bacterial SCP ortholog
MWTDRGPVTCPKGQDRPGSVTVRRVRGGTSGTRIGSAVLEWLDGGPAPDRPVLRAAVKESLAALAAAAPGHSVEVRVPPHGAIQCVSGPRHGRGTPPNVVETDARTWLALVVGRTTWEAAIEGGTLQASGIRSGEVSRLLPLWR